MFTNNQKKSKGNNIENEMRNECKNLKVALYGKKSLIKLALRLKKQKEAT
jgi:hypothetical protein